MFARLSPWITFVVLFGCLSLWSFREIYRVSKGTRIKKLPMSIISCYTLCILFSLVYCFSYFLFTYSSETQFFLTVMSFNIALYVTSASVIMYTWALVWFAVEWKRQSLKRAQKIAATFNIICLSSALVVIILYSLRSPIASFVTQGFACLSIAICLLSIVVGFMYSWNLQQKASSKPVPQITISWRSKGMTIFILVSFAVQAVLILFLLNGSQFLTGPAPAIIATVSFVLEFIDLLTIHFLYAPVVTRWANRPTELMKTSFTNLSPSNFERYCSPLCDILISAWMTNGPVPSISPPAVRVHSDMSQVKNSDLATIASRRIPVLEGNAPRTERTHPSPPLKPTQSDAIPGLSLGVIPSYSRRDSPTRTTDSAAHVSVSLSASARFAGRHSSGAQTGSSIVSSVSSAAHSPRDVLNQTKTNPTQSRHSALIKSTQLLQTNVTAVQGERSSVLTVVSNSSDGRLSQDLYSSDLHPPLERPLSSQQIHQALSILADQGGVLQVPDRDTGLSVSLDAIMANENLMSSLDNTMSQDEQQDLRARASTVNPPHHQRARTGSLSDQEVMRQLAMVLEFGS